jgi:hypothetical protein
VTATRQLIEQGMVAQGVPTELVTEALDAFSEAKRRYHLGDYRPQAVDGGRFSEAVGRIFQWATSGSYTPLGSSTFKMDAAIKSAESAAPSTTATDAMRLHIPRSVRVIYDIRNRRNTAHLRDGIDPNIQDASLVVANMGWIMAELVRHFHNVSPAEAQQLIEGLVSREVPMIQEFNGFPRLLKTLGASDHCLVILYWAGRALTKAELLAWITPSMRKNLPRTLRGLHDRHLVHFEGDSSEITRVGQRYVEAEGLIEPV